MKMRGTSRQFTKQSDEILVLSARASSSEVSTELATHIADPDAHHNWPLLDADIPSTIARDSEVTSAISSHTAVSDAHHNWPLLDADIPSTIVRTSRQVIAGDGLVGGGALTSDVTLTANVGNGMQIDTDAIALALPDTLSVSSANGATTGHSHAITSSSSPGAAASLLATDSSGNLTVYGFGTTEILSHLLPDLTDTRDIGSATKLWRTGWFAELDSLRFVENAIQVIGGIFMIPHASGNVAEDVDASETSIDFGTALDVNDFVIFRGNASTEYMQVTAFESGTTYTVTRNVDGSGANTWAKGSTFAVYGYTGDGRIMLDAQTAAPRIQIVTQGATYNAQTEQVRIGDLSGYGAYTGMGIGIGDATGNRIVYDGSSLTIVGDGGSLTNIDGGNIQTESILADSISVSTLSAISANMGTITAGTITGATIRTSASGSRVQMDTTGIFGTDGATTQWSASNSTGKLTAGNGNVTIDYSGVSLEPTQTTFATFSPNTIKWISGLGGGTFETAYIGGTIDAWFSVGLELNVANDTDTATAEISMEALDSGQGDTSSISLSADSFSSGSGTWSHTGNISATGTVSGASATITGAITGATLDVSGVAETGNLTTTRMYSSGDVIAGGGLTVGLYTTPVDEQIRLYRGATLMGQLSASDTTYLRINQDVAKDILTPRRIIAYDGLSSGDTTDPGAGGLVYTGSLIARRASTNHTGYVFVPYTVPMTNTGWDGDTKTSVNDGQKDTSATWGIPANVKAVSVRVAVQSSTVGDYVALGPSATYYYQHVCRAQVASQFVDYSGIVSCDSNGDFYVKISGTLAVYIQIWGYFI